jgi:hypothetical protein
MRQATSKKSVLDRRRKYLELGLYQVLAPVKTMRTRDISTLGIFRIEGDFTELGTVLLILN